MPVEEHFVPGYNWVCVLPLCKSPRGMVSGVYAGAMMIAQLV